MTADLHVGVLGASGFVGSAVVFALEQRQVLVSRLRAPRISTGARGPAQLRCELRRREVRGAIDELRQSLQSCSVVINAAGLARATAAGDNALVGADALLPAVVAEAAPDHARLIHVSSAAVQGRRTVLDESAETLPMSPYSYAKAWGELLVRERQGVSVCFRPTSVHGPARRVTQSLVRVLKSPAASVAGRGDAPTPQVLVTNVAEAIAFVATTAEEPPPIVLQPWEGLTTGELVRLLGRREPLHLPGELARGIVASTYSLGRCSGWATGVARRLEMMWFGQRQQPGWLDPRWEPPYGREAWKDLM